MSRYERYKEKLSQLQLYRAEQNFLESVDTAILASMTVGEIEACHLGSRLGISEYRLRRYVKRLTGLSLNQYATFIRLRHALELTAEFWPYYHFPKIAKMCGFADHSYFGKVFRRWFDTTPQEYAERIRKNQKTLHISQKNANFAAENPKPQANEKDCTTDNPVPPSADSLRKQQEPN